MNTMKLNFTVAALSMTVCFPSVAASIISGGDLPAAETSKSTSLFRMGIAAISKQSAYQDFDDEATVAPIIMYKGENFYWMISQGGYNFFSNSSSHQLAAIVEIGGDSWKKEDLEDDSFLQDLSIEDRDRAFNAGLLYSYRASWGAIKTKIATDVSDTHEGNYGDISYSYPWRVSDKLMLISTIGVNWIDSDYATYYYGIPGLIEVDDATRVHASIFATYTLDPRWQVMGFLKVVSLDSELEDNPLGILSERRLTDDNTESVVGLGFTYKF
jgi:outer membrane protein